MRRGLAAVVAIGVVAAAIGVVVGTVALSTGGGGHAGRRPALLGGGSGAGLGMGFGVRRSGPVGLPSEGGGGTTNCFPSPGSCSLPSASNQGAEHYTGESCTGAGMTVVTINEPGKNKSLSITSSVTKTVYKVKLHAPPETEAFGYNEVVKVDAPNVVFKQVCFIVEGQEAQGPIIFVSSGETGFKLTESTIKGTNDTTGSYGDAVRFEGNNTGTIEKSVLTNCNECVKATPGGSSAKIVSTHNYFHTCNEGGLSSCSHTEDFFLFNTQLESTEDTLLVPGTQTAISIYEQAAEACKMSMIFTNDLFAGGGFELQGCKAATSEGTAKTTVTKSHFAKCLGGTTSLEGGLACTGGFDSHGYYPNYGLFSIFGTFTGANGMGTVTFSENVRDDTGAPVTLECAKEHVGC